VTALTSLGSVQIIALCLIGIGTVGLVALILIRRLVPVRAEGAGMTAAAYMTALGSLFAILTGFLINSEYGTLRQTQNVVGREAAAASQLAYATAALPPVDAERVQEGLRVYFESLEVAEWSALGRGRAESSRSFDDLAALQTAVYAIGPRGYASDSAVQSMEEAVDGLTAARRERVVIASQELPLPLFVLSVFAGIALVVNALLVAQRRGTAYSLVALGIILIVALDLAAILAISAPFRGPFPVDTAPIAQVVAELAAGEYLPWIRK
jgi:hypothetical protein